MSHWIVILILQCGLEFSLFKLVVCTQSRYDFRTCSKSWIIRVDSGCYSRKPRGGEVKGGLARRVQQPSGVFCGLEFPFVYQVFQLSSLLLK